ncbi:MAG: hypothetical protein K0R24_57 [Gammaproteobacteria bacterium]|jgi:hypothetical protein|nr:hypothetical protein [Gammaproteobacteria bacterium]
MALRHNYRQRTDAVDELLNGVREAQQRALAKEEAELAEEKEKLKQSEARLQQAGEKLAEEKAGLAKVKAELATIKQLEPLSEQEAALCGEASQLANRYTEQFKPRTLLAISIKKGIQEYQGLETLALKKEKLAALEKTLEAIEKARVEEDAVERQYVEKMTAWKDTLAQIKAQLDELPEDRSPYAAYIKGYELSIDLVKRVEGIFEKTYPGKQKLDVACLTLKNNVGALAEKLQAELPDHAMGTPPSPVSSMQASSSTPPRSGSDSDQIAAASPSPSSDRSSGDVSPERSPKKEKEVDEKEIPMQNQLAGFSLQPKSAAPQKPAAPVPPKKGILSGLFGKKSKEPSATVTPANPQQQAKSGTGFKANY